MILYKTENWCDDYGNVLFFHFLNFEEPPVTYVGSCNEIGFNFKCWTHFYRIDFNNFFEQYTLLNGS